MVGWRVEFLATAAPDSTSGLSRGVWALSAALVERGHAVRVLFPSEDLAPIPPFRGVVGVPVPSAITSRRPFARDITIGRNASDLLDPQADVVIGNDEKAGALWWRTRPGGRPVFGMMLHDVSLHTFDTLRPLEPDRGMRQKVGNWIDRRTLKRLEGTALGKARLIVVATDLNRQLLERYYRVRDARVRTIPHGVADPVDVGSRSEARRALKVPDDVPVASFVGGNPERQGLPIALEAFRRVRLFFPGARLLVVGCPAPSDPGVMALGVVDEPTKARALRASDVFVFPARYEGFGLAPREAMRYGLATIASSHVPLEGLDPKREARIVASDDPADYASELAELFADPALRRSLGEAGKAYADQFSYAKMAERFEGALAPLLGPLTSSAAVTRHETGNVGSTRTGPG